jgi:hypothetical protein
MDPKDFLTQLADITHAERAVALIWLNSQTDETASLTVTEICQLFEQAGYSRQQKSKIRNALTKDRRTLKGPNDSFRISPKARAALDETYSEYFTAKPVPQSDSVLPSALFANAKGYTQKVVKQINAGYELSMFDCCAVMSRRLLETLIIECYEECGCADDIKGSDGNYFMFSGLLAHLENNKPFQMSRNGMQGLKQFKQLGDLSAHNRRFNARKSDVKNIRDSLRIACEELLHIANQGP